MTLLTKAQRLALAAGDYQAARALAGERKPRKPMKRKRRTAAEQAEKFAREFHSEERREWVSLLPCLACSLVPCENHHTANDGKGRKGPYTVIVPLCLAHHREAHLGVKSFEMKYHDRLIGRTLLRWSEIVQAAWQLRQGGEE